MTGPLSFVTVQGAGNTTPDWWDPNSEGLTPVGAYRFRTSVGTPWSGGPASYAESLINQVTPGVNDLTEGNGPVAWTAAGGVQFVQANAQWLDTGILPVDGYAILCE